jgi:hypothetical protein
VAIVTDDGCVRSTFEATDCASPLGWGCGGTPWIRIHSLPRNVGPIIVDYFEGCGVLLLRSSRPFRERLSELTM